MESSRRGRWSSRRRDISDFFIGKADRSSGLVLGPVREERLTNESRSRAEAEGNSDGDGNSGRRSMSSKTWTRCDYSQQDSKATIPHTYSCNTCNTASRSITRLLQKVHVSRSVEKAMTPRAPHLHLGHSVDWAYGYHFTISSTCDLGHSHLPFSLIERRER